MGGVGLSNSTISIHSAIASGDADYMEAMRQVVISIHSAIASGDRKKLIKKCFAMISIHSAIASGDLASVPITLI